MKRILFILLLFSCQKQEFTCGQVVNNFEVKGRYGQVSKGYYLWDGNQTYSYHTLDTLSVGDTVCIK